MYGGGDIGQGLRYFRYRYRTLRLSELLFKYQTFTKPKELALSKDKNIYKKMHEGVINTEAKALVATIDNQAAIPHCWSTSELLIKYQKVLF